MQIHVGWLSREKERDWDEVIICICKDLPFGIKNIDSDHRGAVHTGHVQRYVPRGLLGPVREDGGFARCGRQ